MNAMLFHRSFTKQTLPRRIGNLAVTVNRFADALEQHPDRASGFMQEAMWFMEWIGTNLEPEQINLLVITQRQMAHWRKNWHMTIQNESQRQQALQEARDMSQKFLQWAELN